MIQNVEAAPLVPGIRKAAILMIILGDQTSAEILRQLNKFNESAQAYFLAAEAYVSRRDVSKAIEAWTHSTELNPDHLQAFSRLALAYERTNKPAQASGQP